MNYIRIDDDTVITETGLELRRTPPSPHWQAYQDWLAAGNVPKGMKPDARVFPDRGARALPVNFYCRINDECACTDTGVRVFPTVQGEEWAAYEAWLAEGNSPQDSFTPDQWDALNENSKARLGIVKPDGAA